MLFRTGTTPGYCRTINALAVSYAECVAASRGYPVVLIQFDNGSTIVSVVVLGLDLREICSLRRRATGPRHLVPAFLRHYPSCVSRLYVDGSPRGERIICVARAHLNDRRVALFDATEAPTE